MEKRQSTRATHPQQRSSRKLEIWPFLIVLSSSILLWWLYRGHSASWPSFGVPSRGPDEFSWSKVSPSKELVFSSCFEGYECARLVVPLDWNSMGSDSHVTIAVIKIPAPVPVTDHRYGGPILINPGGPGGSGVDITLKEGLNISSIVNPHTCPKSTFASSEKYFDIISFDPRGVNNTSPKLECFPDSSSYDIWRYQQEAEGIDHTLDATLTNAWARSKAWMGTCGKDREISKHMNTVPVVRDMVEIIERHGEWRSKQAELWLASKDGKSSTKGKPGDDLYSRGSIIDRTKWRKGNEKLQYWGFSYGTMLGATFAAINPQRVGRVVLDGVGDAQDYYGTGWMTNLADTDKVMLIFYKYCSEVGSEKCALNAYNSTALEIQASVESLVSSLRHDPISVPGNATMGPEIITYSDLMMMVRYLVYTPLEDFPKMADLLADLVHGHGTAFAEYKRKSHKSTCPLPGPGSVDDQYKSRNLATKSCQPEGHDETSRAILCTDGVDISNTTKEQFSGRIKNLYGDSKWLGEFWSTITLACVHWKPRPTWTITGDEIRGDTSHPILWIGNILDPVTPLKNAHKMSKRFPGSVVLQQNSEGHCSVSSPSNCTQKHVYNYFQTGKLPEPETICQPNTIPLIGDAHGSKDAFTFNRRFALGI